ncbi:HEAT repeat protein [Opisthorchis viverrini]|uniref:HEAT repeat protein n=1 Tax=Opisthorchis viverrini TaxID=6198 RepID=A0A1S8X8V0_OPIVI|nr:HEAT repeat protein [Opisthorchis viverrini]
MSVDVGLLAVLEKSVSPVQQELEAAQHFLEKAAEADLVGLLRQLSDVLCNAECSPVVRMQAGLQLKNALYSKDADIKSVYQQRWLQLTPDARQYIKKNCLAALGTETTAHSSAAQCVAYIACAELPAMQWPDLMNHLVENVVTARSSEACKHATLETIGYICQDIVRLLPIVFSHFQDPNILVSQSNAILTAIVCGMKKEEPSDNVRLAATNALLNSLEFTKHNFDVDNERNYIMQVVCESTQSPHPQIRVAALQCLVKIMSLYYGYMETYMKQALFAIACYTVCLLIILLLKITLDAMKDSIPEVALQGIEFWSTVCDEEIDLAIDAAECYEKGQPPAVSSMFYAKGALQFITPILMEILAHQDESMDDDEWNPSKAAGVCLMLLAQCCEDAIVDLVIPFVKENIKKPDWRYRDAAVMSFGSILEGPNPTALKPLVESAMPVIIELLRDESAAVRDTAAWTIGRVCETLPEVALQDVYLVPLLSGLVEGLSSEPRVAANVCWAISSLAESAYDVASGEVAGEIIFTLMWSHLIENVLFYGFPRSLLHIPTLIDHAGGSGEPKTYALSQYFNAITERLLATSSRPDGGQHNLRNAAYSALMALMRSAAQDCYGEVQRVTVVVLERLESVIGLENQLASTQDRAQFNDLQSLLCGTLQSVLRKISKEDAPAISDKVLFNCFLFISKCPVEEPFFFVSTLPLQNVNADKSLRPAIISTFGDLSLALGSEFLTYLPLVMETLKQATQAEVNLTDPDMVEYLNSLRTSCLEAYTGIVQGLKGDGPRKFFPQWFPLSFKSNPIYKFLCLLTGATAALEFVASHVPHILSFIEHINVDSITTDELISASCGLIGDLVSAYGASILSLVDVDSIANVLQRGRRAKSSRTKNLAVWATKEIRKLKNVAHNVDLAAVSGSSVTPSGCSTAQAS